MNDVPTRNVLDGIPWIGFYRGGKRCPEDLILPSAMRAVLEYLGESEPGARDYGCKHRLAQNPDCKILCTYAYLVGVSGAASFLSWKDGWHGDNVALSYMSADPEAPEQNIFKAIGYEYEWVVKEPGRDNEAVFRQTIAESLQRGMPVLGYGVAGPPEASIVAGYDEGGEVLIGWSFFQDPAGEQEPSGYSRQRDWFEGAEALLIIGGQVERPALKETYRDALHWMLHVTRTPMVRPEPDAPEEYRSRHNGLAAYMAWAAHLLNDAAWPAGDESVLRAHYQIHNDAVGTVAEARFYGSVFLAQIVEGFEAGPGRPGRQAELLHAAACYAAEHDLMWEIWKLAGGIGNREAHKAMADPNVRRAMAEIIRQAREQDAQAADHIERALA
jgi:hypothetical protein